MSVAEPARFAFARGARSRSPLNLAVAIWWVLSGGGCGGCVVSGGLPECERRRVAGRKAELCAEPKRLLDQGCNTEGYGFDVRMNVDDRGFIDIGKARDLDEAPDDDTLEVGLAVVKVELSKNGHGATEVEGEWRIHHMLDEGPLFRSGYTEAGELEPDIVKLPSSVEVAVENLGDEKLWHQPNMWKAIEASPSHPAIDIVALQRWPGSDTWAEKLSRPYVRRLAKPRSRASKAWRVAFQQRATTALAEGDGAMREAAEVMVLADGKATDPLLNGLLPHWPRSDAAHELLADHADEGSEAFKKALASKASAELGKYFACRASILLSAAAPEKHTCADADEACAAKDERRAKRCRSAQ